MHPPLLRPSLLRLALLPLALLSLLPLASAWGKASSASSTPGGAPLLTPVHVREELTTFPYSGRGDAFYSFHAPFPPSPSGGPLMYWDILGAAAITSREGRDVVRLTSAAQGLQGVVYTGKKTRSMDFNGYFDVLLTTSPDSHEVADGMGFFFTKDLPEKGSAMGLAHTFEGFGVIVDTFSNSRKRHVPHLFAYVSDGKAQWNPDADGADIELTAGCKLRMDTPTRIHVQFLDRNLHVAVSENGAHHKWHSCFKYNNVPLSFSGGGWLAFAGETGHYFGVHDVDTAAFAVGDISEDVAVRQKWLDNRRKLRVKQDRAVERAEMEEAMRTDEARRNAEEQEAQRLIEVADAEKRAAEKRATEKAATQPPPHPTVAAASSAAQQQATAQAPHQARAAAHVADGHPVLEDAVDREVDSLYHDLAEMLRDRAANPSGAAPDAVLTSIAGSMKSLGAMSSHLMQEIDRQRDETESVTTALKTLHDVNSKLNTYASSFSDEIKTLHDSTHDLRDGHASLKDDHEDTNSLIDDHTTDVHDVLIAISEAQPHGVLSMLIFICLQTLLLAAGVVVYKMGPPRKAGGRV